MPATIWPMTGLLFAHGRVFQQVSSGWRELSWICRAWPATGSLRICRLRIAITLRSSISGRDPTRILERKRRFPFGITGWRAGREYVFYQNSAWEELGVFWTRKLDRVAATILATRSTT